jgi:SAM-dependent methyltransferase
MSEGQARYTIAGGQAGKQRLDVLAAAMRPHTGALLDAVGIPAGARCLDVGCGGGHVALELARRAGPTGHVLGLDRDAEVLALARADAARAGASTVDFQEGDASDLRASVGPRGPFRVAYARFLLSHLADPAGTVEGMAALLAPGGAVVLEDIDFTGAFCHPANRGYRRYVELYRETVRRRGGDADLGPQLPALLRRAGMHAVDVRVAQPVALTGPGKAVNLLTLERIAPAVLAERVAGEAEVTEVLDELRAFTADDASLIAFPRIVQAWAHRPSPPDAPPGAPQASTPV